MPRTATSSSTGKAICSTIARSSSPMGMSCAPPSVSASLRSNVVADRVFDDAKAGLLLLTQLRLGTNIFEYRATRRRQIVRQIGNYGASE